MLAIEQIRALKDNYVYLLREPASGLVGVVDPSEAPPVKEALTRLGWKLDFILNTHHHNDHTGGNLELKETYGAKVVGARHDAPRIAGIDIMVSEGERFALGQEEAEVIEVPGHTSGHIAFWFAGSDALFCGDTLFTLGCGRLFEGTAPQMWKSLSKLRALPGTALVHCGHEYTQSNARFAVTVEPNNQALAKRSAEVDAARAKGQSTVPAPLSLELATNPFLRADKPEVQKALGMEGQSPEAVFAEIRGRKDKF